MTRALVLAALFGALAATVPACDRGDPAIGCGRDTDCPEGARCELAAGVCVDFRNPLDAQIPDSGAPLDGGGSADGAFAD